MSENRVLKNINPERVMYYFEEISKIPHGSGNTRKISDFLVEFAKENKLEYIQDESGNVIIFKNGYKGYENSPSVIIQGHMDMVCEKEADSIINFEKDGLELIVEENCIHANKTTLGGDDGIAVAYALAILESKEIPHPPLEVVITVDEEIGMLGATALDCSSLKSKIMLNLDSEDEGHLLVSCAGGATVNLKYDADYEVVQNGILSVIEIGGISSGHSGMEIIKQGANAAKLMGRLLYAISEETDVRINSLNAGEKDNAIPRLANASVFFASEDEFEKAQSVVESYNQIFYKEYKNTDENIYAHILKPVKIGCKCMTKESSKTTIAMLNTVPNGVKKMSREIEGLVQTSLNLGIARTEDNKTNQTVCLGFSVRSSVDSEKKELIYGLKNLAQVLGVSFFVSGDYPAWEYKEDSVLRNLMFDIYKEMYDKEPVIDAIHAGVECGIFAGKLEGLDCVSIGPDMNDIHTPKETIFIDSIERTWNYILEILKRLK